MRTPVLRLNKICNCIVDDIQDYISDIEGMGAFQLLQGCNSHAGKAIHATGNDVTWGWLGKFDLDHLGVGLMAIAVAL